MQLVTRCMQIIPYKLQETLWGCIVVSSFISKVDFTHIVDTAMDIRHELADGLAQFRLECTII